MLEAQLLIVTAASIAFAHTILGPDHYLVFAAMGKARNWSTARTLRITLYCGIGHVLGSVLLGAIGLVIGARLASLVAIEGLRGNLAGWALLAFGLMYLAWGLRNAGRSQVHSRTSITPWALFVVFLLGPCEALIPLFMYPAAKQDIGLVVAVATVFGVVTLLTMLAGVAITLFGLERMKLPSLGRYSHAVAGGSIVLCGGAINFLGL
ncbi:MAG: hypothetical protein QNJ11_11060 [Woeseiaceae bacterium]|nr:hypothetical protein [Woeseiaceae bacterium]